MEPLISVLRDAKNTEKKYWTFFVDQNQSKKRRASPSVTPRAKKTSLQRELLMAVPVKNNPQ